MEQQAHEYATSKALAYAAKFKTRGVRSHAVDGVYLNAYVQFFRRAASA